jgi:hypothetical protein
VIYRNVDRTAWGNGSCASFNGILRNECLTRPSHTVLQRPSPSHRHPHSTEPPTCIRPSFDLTKNVGQAILAREISRKTRAKLQTTRGLCNRLNEGIARS